MLSASHAAIPSKLFEYIPASRPILTLTPTDSAVWRMGKKVPQMHLVDYLRDDLDFSETVCKFLAACRADAPAEVPEEFSEAGTARIFRAALALD